MRNKTSQLKLLALLISLTMVSVMSLWAENNTTNVIDGTSINITTNYNLGSSGAFNALIITNGGYFFTGRGSLIGATHGDDNRVTITGVGSKWISQSNIYVGYYGDRNQLVVTNGGQLSNTVSVTGYAGSHNLVTITGPGSKWISRRSNSFIVGYNGGFGNQVVVTNGGTLETVGGRVGGLYEIPPGGGIPPSRADFNTAEVTGAGSSWVDADYLQIGDFGYQNTLNIKNGAAVIAGGVVLHNQNNVINMTGGRLFVTNAAKSAEFVMESQSFCHLNITNSIVTLDTLRNLGAFIDFTSGILTIGTSTNNFFLTVGNGSSKAVLNLLAGTHVFTNGLRISSNALLQAVGMVTGNITNFGTLALGATSNKLTIKGILNQNPSATLTLHVGGVSQGLQYNFISVTGAVQCAGSLRLACVNNFTPNSNDVFTVVQGSSLAGTFVNAANGARLKTKDNLGSFRVDYTATTLQLADYQSTELDGDGIEDAWAMQYFGHSPLTPEEKTADGDGDGLSNYGEFQAGTNPNDATSVFKLTSLQVAGNATLQFGVVPGKAYRVWYSNDLLSWNEIATPLFKSFPNGICQWTDDGLQTGSVSAEARFYRVAVD